MNFIFPYIGNVIIPSDDLIFFRGVGQPPTRKPSVADMNSISLRFRTQMTAVKNWIPKALLGLEVMQAVLNVHYIDDHGIILGYVHEMFRCSGRNFLAVFSSYRGSSCMFSSSSSNWSPTPISSRARTGTWGLVYPLWF